MLASTPRKASIQWFSGCDPDNPNRPRMQITPLLRKDVFLSRLSDLFFQVADGNTPEKQREYLLLFDDILVVMGCASDEDRLAVFGEDGHRALLEYINTPLNIVLHDPKDS